MPATLNETFRRNARALELRDSLGRGTAVTTATLLDGARTRVTDGNWSYEVDLSARSGGTGAAPDPGVFGRGALASCLASTYALWAAHRGIPIEALTVEVHADYDARGMYGVGNAVADYVAIRPVVTIRSPAPDDAVRALIREADEHCVYLNVFRLPHDLAPVVHIER